MNNVLACILMAVITFPLAFFIARGCLGLVIRIVNGEETAMCYDRSREVVVRGFLRVVSSPPPPAAAAENLVDAARELASKTAAWAGRGEAIAATWRNQSSLGPAGLAQAQAAFETVVRVAEGSAAEARITLSENQTHYLLVAEARRGDDRQIWIASWKRNGSRPASVSPVTLEKKLLWEQDEPILDVALAPDVMIVLSPGKLTWIHGGVPVSVALGRSRINWPRDPRGRIRAVGPAFDAYLPGLLCRFTATATAADCRASGDPWVLESGSRAMLLANFEITRNFFDGRVSTQNGQRKTVPPFYSAAAIEDRGNPLRLLALVDGRTQIFDAAFDPVGIIPGWGSDIAGAEAMTAPCGAGQQILATRPGDGSEPDAIQAFTLMNRSPASLGGALAMLDRYRSVAIGQRSSGGGGA